MKAKKIPSPDVLAGSSGVTKNDNSLIIKKYCLIRVSFAFHVASKSSGQFTKNWSEYFSAGSLPSASIHSIDFLPEGSVLENPNSSNGCEAGSANRPGLILAYFA